MSEKILGLELSASALTAVVIQKSFKNCTVIDSCRAPFPDKNGETKPYREKSSAYFLKDAGENRSDSAHRLKSPDSLQNTFCAIKGWQWDSDSFEKALVQLLSKLDLKGCSASALCLSATLVSFRNIEVPFSSVSKIKQILPFELTSHLPMNHSGYLSDFILVEASDTLEKESDNFSVEHRNYIFTASLPVDVMEICFPVLKKYGIQPQIVTSQGSLSSICLENGVVIEATQADTVISVLFNRKVIAVRSFCGGKEPDFILKAVNQTLLGIRHRYNIEISQDRFYLLSEDIDCAAQGERKKEVNFLSDAIERSLGHEVHQVSAGDYADIGGASVRLSGDLHEFNAFASALCCARRSNTINFCQGYYAKDSFVHKFKDQLVVLFVFAAITAIALFINIEYDITLLKREVATLDAAITQTFRRSFPDVKIMVEPLMQMQVKIREIEKQNGVLPGDIGAFDPSEIRVVDILYELSIRIPKSVDVELTRFLINEGRVVMAGSTDNFNTVDKIKTMIEKYGRFKSVTINSATADKNGSRVLFNFLIELK